jgi:CheY-like chemotaxis protein
MNRKRSATVESGGRERGARSSGESPRAEGPPGGERGVAGAPSALLELAGLQVLLVEDHALTRHVLEAALQTRGAIVTTAESAAAARDALGRVRPHVVLSDIDMPGEDGYAFVRKLRASEVQGGPRLAAIALTGHTTEHDRNLALAAGFDAHVPKPLDFNRLVSMIGMFNRGR